MKPVVIVVAAGAALAAGAAASAFWVPQRWEWVLYTQSSGANEIRIPIGYWLVVTAWLLALSRATRSPLRAIAPRAIVIAIVTHMLVLLAAFSAILDDGGAFTTGAYQSYARIFSVTVLAVCSAAAVHVVQNIRQTSVAMASPIVAAAGLLAVMLLCAEPVLASAAIVTGRMAWTAAGRRHLRAGASWVRAWLAGERAFMATLFLAALALRLLYLQRVMSNPGYVETGADGPVYDELAWSIAQGKGIRESFTERFPMLLLGYVWFVSGIYKIAGHNYFAVGAVQAVIGSAACVVFYRVAREICGSAIARTAAWFAVISFPLLFAAAAIGHQAIDVFLTVLIVWMLVKSTPAWPWWRWVAVGVVFGLAIAVRETVTFFLVFALVWIPFRFARPWSWRAVGAAAVVAAATIGTLAPIAAPKLATERERDKLRHHFDILFRGEADPIRMRDDIVAPLSDPSAALAQLRESPSMVLGTLGRAWASNFAVQFFAQPYGGFDLVFLRKGTAYYYGLWFYAYALAVAGVVILLRRLRVDARAAAIALVLGVIASRTVPHVLLESNYRHRVPIEPFLILLAATTVVHLVGSARQSATEVVP